MQSNELQRNQHSLIEMINGPMNYRYSQRSVFAEAMPSKRSEQRQTMKVSRFTEIKACSEVVIGTAK